MAVADEYCALNIGAAAVAPVLVIVTPAPAAKLVSPAPIDITVILAPIGYATDEFGGIVMATVAALLEVTILPASASTKVYVVPVWALIAYVTPSNGRVQFVKVPLDGVPKIGVTKVGLVDNTVFPVPVDEVTPVPPFATGRVPVTPVVNGKPVILVATPLAGVPNAGVTKVGDKLVYVFIADNTTDLDTAVLSLSVINIWSVPTTGDLAV